MTHSIYSHFKQLLDDTAIATVDGTRCDYRFEGDSIVFSSGGTDVLTLGPDSEGVVFTTGNGIVGTYESPVYLAVYRKHEYNTEGLSPSDLALKLASCSMLVGDTVSYAKITGPGTIDLYDMTIDENNSGEPYAFININNIGYTAKDSVIEFDGIGPVILLEACKANA